MGTIALSRLLTAVQVSDSAESSHGHCAVHRNGDICVVYSDGPAPQTVKYAIYKRIVVGGNPVGGTLYAEPIRGTLATPAGAVTPTGNADPSCSHPRVAAIRDGFAVTWERRDTVVLQTAMTVGGMQIEVAKLKISGSGYSLYAVGAAGVLGGSSVKGYVLDNTVIAGHAGGTPRIAKRRPFSNVVGLVYGSQLTHSEVAQDVQRTWQVRAAYLDFTPDGKPTFVQNGNRTGGSVSDAADGGYAAGPTQIYLVTGLDLDANAATQDVFAAGGGLPDCIFDPRGDFAVAYEVRNGKDAQGGIVLRVFPGPFRGTGLDQAAILTDTTSFPSAAAPQAARRPVMALRNPLEYGSVQATTNLPALLMCYGSQVPNTPDSGTVVFKTLTYPKNGTPVPAPVTVAANQNDDGTTDEVSLPFTVDGANLSGCFVQERLRNVSGGDGYKWTFVPVSGSNELVLAQMCERPQRIAVSANYLADKSEIMAFTYEGQDPTGSSAQHVWLEIRQLA